MEKELKNMIKILDAMSKILDRMEARLLELEKLPSKL